MKRFKKIFDLLSEADGEGVDILNPQQDSAIPKEQTGGVEPTEPSQEDDDVELVNLVLAALRTKIDNTQRHYFAGEAFKTQGPVTRLQAVRQMVDANKPVTEAIGDEESEDGPPKPPGGGPEGGPPKPPGGDEPPTGEGDAAPEMPMPDEQPEEPLELGDMAETAVRALLVEPDQIHHALQNIPYEATLDNYREVFKAVKSKLYY